MGQAGGPAQPWSRLRFAVADTAAFLLSLTGVCIPAGWPPPPTPPPSSPAQECEERGAAGLPPTPLIQQRAKESPELLEQKLAAQQREALHHMAADKQEQAAAKPVEGDFGSPLRHSITSSRSENVLSRLSLKSIPNGFHVEGSEEDATKIINSIR